jgi:hypothetical protein
MVQLWKTIKNDLGDSLFKLVREKHVKTDEHWTKSWYQGKGQKAKLKWEWR